MTTYTHEFYATRDQATRYAAETILGLVLNQIPPVHSAIDIGCGVGTWLSVLKAQGVRDTQGYDGAWVERELLQTEQDCFGVVSLAHAFPAVERRYDLAISLEVAEHLPEARASDFVKFLTELSDTVLFSAAIPGQGGTGHVNEQWPKYWTDMFYDHGYTTTDALRGQIWSNAQIPFWYRQNALLFTKTNNDACLIPQSLVHPELFLAHAKPGVNGCIKKLREAVNEYVGKA